MRTFQLIIFVLFFKTLASQTIVSDKKGVWSFTFYEFAGNLDKDGVYEDTMYSIQKFPAKNDWKIYFDTKKTSIATLVHYDSIQKTITTRHYSRAGKLLQEHCAKYKNKKDCNPSHARLIDFKYLKMFRNDSLICEMTGQEQLISVKYRNSFTNDFFDQTMYFSTHDNWRDDFIGSDVWRYYETGSVKSICKTIREDSLVDGSNMTILSFKCKTFDVSGYVIKDK